MPDATPKTVLPPEKAARLMKLATYASVSVALVLIVSKFAAWLMTDAISLLSTLIDSLLDVGASVLNLIAVRHALEPADKEHRFGHGKAEALSGLAQAAFITGSAVFLLLQAGERLYHPRQIENTDVGFGVMMLAIVLTLGLVAFQRHVVRQTGSVAISADSAHYQMDVLVNVSVIISLLLVSRFGLSLADPLFAIAIAIYIIWGAWRIGQTALHMLMDRELDDAQRRRVMEIARINPGVKGVHDLRTRSSGNQVFIQMHLEMDGDITLMDAHVIADDVEIRIMKAFPNAEVIIHEDPEGIEQGRAVFH
ncbi:MAG: cation diffusion facilitator family transporter [Proteobacteria bacterium]|nr:cation diffusion facilitator family transporter [Pseudomonadota bacterium]MDA1021825.1 cation diffusion facilitator family transporter [Pseudomonadota bacterium]